MKNITDLNAGKAANDGSFLEQKLIEITGYIVAKLQEKDVNGILKFFHKDMLLEKGNAGLIIRGFSNISKTMASSEKLVSAANQYRFRVVLLEKRLAVLTGSSIFFKSLKDTCPEASHLTLIWKRECNGWYLFYLHVPDFADTSPQLILNGADGICYAVREQQIQYIEAQGKTSIIYLRIDGSPHSIGSKTAQRLYGNNSIIIREGIRHIKERLTSRFIGIHRSYIANIYYVLSIRRYELILTGGVRIPIPAAKYKSIKAEILNLLRYLQ